MTRGSLFTPEALRRELAMLDTPRRYLVAYSGGMDSHVLLHALAVLDSQQVRCPVLAVHIDHGLHPDSAAWAEHCRDIAAGLGVMAHVQRVQVSTAGYEGMEAGARRARYGAFAGLVQTGDCLLTAHHQDDLAETVLVQLLRGAGPEGLAAMPKRRVFAGGLLVRPLLDFRREVLREYAERERLHWIEDPSNRDLRHTRNYLRRELMPRLAHRFPGHGETLARAARHQADAARLLMELGRQDVTACRGPQPHTLRMDAFGQFAPERQRNVLRVWLKSLGLPVPDSRRLERIVIDVVPAARDATPRVCWPGAEVRRYRGLLYAVPTCLAPVSEVMWSWNLREPLTLPWGTLAWIPALGPGLDCDITSRGKITVRLRKGGERIRPLGARHRREVKKLLQEAGVPPWERARLPLLFVDDALAAVPNVALADDYAAPPQRPGCTLVWRPQAI